MTEDLRERIADRLFGQIHGQGITSPLLLADAVLEVLADADPRSIEQSPWEAYEALIESIMKNADHDFWDSGSDIEAVAYVRHLEDEVERLRRVCLRRAFRTWVGEFDEEGDHG